MNWTRRNKGGHLAVFLVGLVLGVIIGSFGFAMYATEEMNRIKAEARDSVQYWRGAYFKEQDKR